MPPIESAAAPASVPPVWVGLLLFAILLVGLGQLISLARGIEAHRERWRSGERSLAWRPFFLRDVGWVTLGLLASAAVGGLLVQMISGGRDADPGLHEIDLFLQFFAVQVMTVLGAALLMRRKGLHWRDAFGDSRRGLAPALLYALRLFLAVLPVVALMGVLTAWVLETLGIPPRAQDVMKLLLAQDDPLRLSLVVFFAVVAAPVSEEIFFRGLLLPALAKWCGAPRAVLYSSLAFALIHFAPQQMPALFVLSLALSLGYLYTRRLESAIALHALFNGFMLTLAFTLPDAVPQ
jgi:membrane protease YdiL (CAAX protease family)